MSVSQEEITSPYPGRAHRGLEFSAQTAYSADMSTMIYKIVRAQEWRLFERERQFSGSADDIRDGYIHFSTRSQVAGTLQKYFAAEASLDILEVPTATLDADALEWEASRGGALFPHLYATLRLSAVSRRWTVPLLQDGRHDLSAFNRDTEGAN